MAKMDYSNWEEKETCASDVYTRHRASKELSKKEMNERRSKLDDLIRESGKLCREIASTSHGPIEIQTLQKKKARVDKEINIILRSKII